MVKMLSSKIKKGDRVQVLSGKDRGKQGRVLKIFPDEARVVVEGMNRVKRHARPSKTNPQGGIIEKEMPIHISTVGVVCSSCDKPTRIGTRFDEKGLKFRICRKCGTDLD